MLTFHPYFYNKIQIHICAILMKYFLFFVSFEVINFFFLYLFGSDATIQSLDKYYITNEICCSGKENDTIESFILHFSNVQLTINQNSECISFEIFISIIKFMNCFLLSTQHKEKKKEQ